MDAAPGSAISSTGLAWVMSTPVSRRLTIKAAVKNGRGSPLADSHCSPMSVLMSAKPLSMARAPSCGSATMAPMLAAAPKRDAEDPDLLGRKALGAQPIHRAQHILALLDPEGKATLAAHAVPAQIEHQHVEPGVVQRLGQVQFMAGHSCRAAGVAPMDHDDRWLIGAVGMNQAAMGTPSIARRELDVLIGQVAGGGRLGGIELALGLGQQVGGDPADEKIDANRQQEQA